MSLPSNASFASVVQGNVQFGTCNFVSTVPSMYLNISCRCFCKECMLTAGSNLTFIVWYQLGAHYFHCCTCTCINVLCTIWYMYTYILTCNAYTIVIVCCCMYIVLYVYVSFCLCVCGCLRLYMCRVVLFETVILSASASVEALTKPNYYLNMFVGM